MASYKTLNETQISRMNNLASYGVRVNVIAEKVGADYYQVYQYFKVNGKPEVIPYEQMGNAQRSHYTRMLNKKELSAKYRTLNKTKKVVNVERVTVKAPNEVKHVIPAGIKYTVFANEDGTVNIIY
jgi:hypothetical protein